MPFDLQDRAIPRLRTDGDAYPSDGAIAVVEDHINLSGIHPLHGPNDDSLGPRFPDMSDPYTEGWRTVARHVPGWPRSVER